MPIHFIDAHVEVAIAKLCDEKRSRQLAWLTPGASVFEEQALPMCITLVNGVLNIVPPGDIRIMNSIGFRRYWLQYYQCKIIGIYERFHSTMRKSSTRSFQTVNITALQSFQKKLDTLDLGYKAERTQAGDMVI